MMQLTEWQEVMSSKIDRPGSFCSEEEAQEISGVTARSLRLLQTLGVIEADTLGIGGGSKRRAWRLHDVAVAAVVQQIKNATNLSYESVSERISASKINLIAVLIDLFQSGKYDHSGVVITENAVGVSHCIDLQDRDVQWFVAINLRRVFADVWKRADAIR
jgi:hypothetical protein